MHVPDTFLEEQVSTLIYHRGLPELTEGWAYRVDGVPQLLCYGPGPWPFYVRERPRSPKKGPSGCLRLSPDVAVYAWGPEYVLLGPDRDTEAGASATLHLGRDYDKRVQVHVDLTDCTFEIEGDVGEHGDEAQEKAGKLADFLRVCQQERDKGKTKPGAML